ncbi:MAG TPA: hypothetical protein VFL80_07110 [Thermoanaerobaculia bacterium]|nr:hypothetical protein [Thermoanaerobaculia bacterium]
MHEFPVTVSVSGLEPEEYFVYLAPYSRRRQGPEIIDDYLSSGRRFFPMIKEGAPKMIGRDQIIWVRCPRPSEDDASLDITVIERIAIIELADGARIEGVMPIERPREQSRISDVLNDPYEAFVRIDGEDASYFVNKRFIRQVVPR